MNSAGDSEESAKGDADLQEAAPAPGDADLQQAAPAFVQVQEIQDESSGDAAQLTTDTTSPGSGAHQDTTEEGIRDLTQMPPAPESAMDTDKADPIFGGALTSPRSTGSADDLTANFARAEIVSQVNIL